jgi:hypothetical protein
MTHVMTCTECLSLVATGDVTELATTAALTEHCRTCADCASVVDEIAEAARRLADTLDGTLPGVPAQVVALRAVAGAARDRRRAGRLRATLTVVGVTAASLAGLVLLRTFPDAGSVGVRTVALRCLRPAQVAALAQPELPPQVTVSFRPAGQPLVLTLRGPERDLATAEQVIARLDARWSTERGAYCLGAQGRPVPTPMPTSVPGPAPMPTRTGPT